MTKINKPDHALFITKMDFYNKFGKDFTIDKYSEIPDERAMYSRLCTYDHLADTGSGPTKEKKPDHIITYYEYLEFLERHSIYRPSSSEKVNAKAVFEDYSVKFHDPNLYSISRPVIQYAVLSSSEAPQYLIAVSGDRIKCSPGNWIRFRYDELLVRTVLDSEKEQSVNIGSKGFFMQNGKFVSRMVCMPNTELEFHDNKNVKKFTPARPFQISVDLTFDGKKEHYIIQCASGKEVICWENGRPWHFYAANGEYITLSDNGIE